MAKLKLLVIGGTMFLGRHLVDAALESRCEVTLFNRGKTNPNLFPNVETVIGDRDRDLDKLADRKWDAVVDTCGYVPRVVAESAKFLASRVKNYTFISTISVYADPSQQELNESSPLAELAEPTENVTEETYGALKVLCEKKVLSVFPSTKNGLIVRPGLIVGPWDPTDRFTYWVERVERGGEILAPGPASRSVQFIDARDLAKWTLQMIKKERSGIYNAVGPFEKMTMQTFLNLSRDVTASDAKFTWVSEEFLTKEGVYLPVWVPESYLGYANADNRLFAESGKLRKVEKTVADTQIWLKTQRGDGPLRAGLPAEIEKELLKKWHSQNS